MQNICSQCGMKNAGDIMHELELECRLRYIVQWIVDTLMELSGFGVFVVIIEEEKTWWSLQFFSIDSNGFSSVLVYWDWFFFLGLMSVKCLGCCHCSFTMSLSIFHICVGFALYPHIFSRVNVCKVFRMLPLFIYHVSLHHPYLCRLCFVSTCLFRLLGVNVSEMRYVIFMNTSMMVAWVSYVMLVNIFFLFWTYVVNILG